MIAKYVHLIGEDAGTIYKFIGFQNKDDKDKPIRHKLESEKDGTVVSLTSEELADTKRWKMI